MDQCDMIGQARWTQVELAYRSTREHHVRSTNRPKLIESSSLAARSDFDIKQMALESADRLLLENEDSLDAWLLQLATKLFHARQNTADKKSK